MPECIGRHAARFEPFVQTLDQLTLAGAIRPADDEDHGKLAFAQGELGLEQAGAQ